MIGNAIGYGSLCTDVVAVSRSKEPVRAGRLDVSRSSTYRAAAAWCLVSPLIWSLPGMPGFITLTIIANAAAVVLLPVLSASLRFIAARTSFIGQTHRNGWWENSLMATLFAFSLWGAYQSVLSVAAALPSGS